MFTTLYESTCVTSALHYQSQLLLCSPPNIKLYKDKAPFELISSSNYNAKFIYQLDTHLAILSLEDQIQFYDLNLKLIQKYQLSQSPLAIINYQDFLLIEYKYEYQQCYYDNIGPLIRKDNIISFAPNPFRELVYVIKNDILENNEVHFKQKIQNIEIGVEQLYLISQTQSLYIYQSAILPQLTIIDLDKQLEVCHIDFVNIIDNVFIYGNRILIQSNLDSYELINNKLQKFAIFHKMISCCLQFNKFEFYGSIHDNPIICQNNQIIREFQNLGQIVDIHPYLQSCYVVSYNKQYPVSLFRKGINEQIIKKFKISESEQTSNTRILNKNNVEPDKYPRKIFFINKELILLSYAKHSEIYSIPQFNMVHIGLITNAKTILVQEIYENTVLQVTQRNVLLISNYIVIQSKHFEFNICIAQLENNLLCIYAQQNIYIYQVTCTDLIYLSSIQANNLSTLTVQGNQVLYCKWFCNSIFRSNESYPIPQITTTVVSMQLTKMYLLLGSIDGQIIVINPQNFTFVQYLTISNTHPLKMIKYNDKVLIITHHSYMMDDSLKITIVNWDHLYDISVSGDNLVGIVNNEIQLVNLSKGSSSQCQELKYIQNKIVVAARLFRDHLILLVNNQGFQLESYYDDQLKQTINLSIEVEKMDLLEYVVIIGQVGNQGKIIFYNEHLQQMNSIFTKESVYDIKMTNEKEIYYSTNTCIYNLNNTFHYDFQVPILGFDIQGHYFIIYEEHTGAHLFLFEDQLMIALGSINNECQYSTFYYEDIIAFSKSYAYVGKPNQLTMGISDQMEINIKKHIEVSCVRDSNYSTIWGEIGYYE